MNRTTRGVYVNIPDSPITIKSPSGTIIHFSSYKKREMYVNRMVHSLTYLRTLNDKLKKLTGVDFMKSFDNEMKHVIENMYEKVYNDMQYK